ncbi:MAG TPA: hypothetical protein VEW48_10090 [Thermoanaerobaculia bacterium]|nr:hypothetical protein [Thermoanaerobaculia bacterium]
MRTKTMRTLAMILAMAGSLCSVAGTAMAQSDQEKGILKVCKVAGPGVPIGTLFTFTVDSKPPFTVPAGPGPDGYCVVGPSFPVGSVVTVTETLTNGNQVTGINVNPPNQLVGIFGNTVHVKIGSGVTEVTFTNERTGYLQICKQTDPAGGTGSYQFYVGGLGPYTVPAGACSPAIKLPAGPVVITEVQGPGVQMLSCSTLPIPSLQLNCNPGAGTSTVDVRPGNVSNQTIAIITNRPMHHLPNVEDPTSSTKNQQQ